MPDLLAGTTVQDLDTPETEAGRATAFWSFTTTSFSKTIASGTQPSAGFTFVASTTGRAMVSLCAAVRSDSAGNDARIAFEVREGAVVGSGTVRDGGAAVDKCIRNANAQSVVCHRTYLLTGLTPGDTYNIDIVWQVSAGTGFGDDLDLIVEPAT